MSKRFAAFLAVFAGLATVARADDLTVGDPAPKLQVKEFVKGEPVKEFEKGKTYVVEFWATWCGPCRTSIPHLTELQKKHKDVTFIGVSVWEESQAAVAPYVKEMGDKMDYRVALDSLPEGGDRNDGKMARTWMAAAGENGIPAAFIVNGDGKVAWIGHPMSMEEPLEKVISGSWDLGAAVAERKEAKVRERKIAEISGKIREAQQSGDSKALVKVVDEALADMPSLEPALGTMKFQALRKAGESEKAVTYAKHLVEKVCKDNANALNQIAWSIVDPEAEKADAKCVEVALAAARRADELSKGKDAPIADTYAKALFDSGKVDEAVTTQERAVSLAKGTPLEQDQGMKDRLEQYRKAAKK